MASNFPPDGYVRLNVNLPHEVHKHLKMVATMTETTMSNLIKDLITDKLQEMLREGIQGPRAAKASSKRAHGVT